MTIYNKRESFVLFLGDIFFLVASLWLTLFLRALEIPSQEIFLAHLEPFSLLFVAWIAVFYIFGLYGKHTLFFKTRLPFLLLDAQLLNGGIAALFFYFIPFFDIAPKTILLLSCVVSFFLILLWRMKIATLLGFRRRERAILIGAGSDKDLLYKEVRGNSRYAFTFVTSLDINKIDGINFDEDILKPVQTERVSVIVLDFSSDKLLPLLPHFYNLLFAGVRFFDINTVYEEIFDRVPVSSLHHSWVLKNISASSTRGYDFLKRAMDILASFPLSILSLLLFPFVYLAMKWEDAGPIFTKQVRVGKGNIPVAIYKLRTMSVVSESGADTTAQHITRVGKFLRKSRIDELPQLWNVLRGDLSLIGPRQEFPHLAKLYEEKIPYYNVRHLIKPGLSGWAQINMEKPPKFSVGYNETQEKLSYDLYYIKHRSFLLDIKIALFTIKTLLSRSGV